MLSKEIKKLTDGVIQYVCGEICPMSVNHQVNIVPVECLACSFCDKVNAIHNACVKHERNQAKLHGDVDDAYLEKCREVEKLKIQLIKMADETRILCDQIREMGCKRCQ